MRIKKMFDRNIQEWVVMLIEQKSPGLYSAILPEVAQAYIDAIRADPKQLADDLEEVLTEVKKLNLEGAAPRGH